MSKRRNLNSGDGISSKLKHTNEAHNCLKVINIMDKLKHEIKYFEIHIHYIPVASEYLK